jgi:Uma2 family endonuclease
MAHPATATGYSVEDLDWVRAELGIAHLELDPWGSLIASLVTDDHEAAVALLHGQVVRQLDLPPGLVWSNGVAWKVPGGSGYLNVPDLAVLAPGWHRVDGYHMDPPPLLVVEVASPSTRAVDRGRKLDDYRLGGAGLYLLVDLPARAPATDVPLEAHDFATGEVVIGTNAIDLVVGGTAIRFSFPGLS